MDIWNPQPKISVRNATAATTDDALVGAARAGNRTAFAELWRRHSTAALKMAYRITKNPEDAEDVIQDAWLKAYVHLASFDGRAKFSTWLTRIVINLALITLRRRRSHPETSMEIVGGEIWHEWEIADQMENVEELYARHERIDRLKQAIRLLRPSLRNVIELRHSQDRSIKEIADLVGISVPATKSRFLRARKLLRKNLAERGGKLDSTVQEASEVAIAAAASKYRSFDRAIS
jgi:RNA polymerase sigma-70 factor (ECF subfamily)